MVNAGHWQAQRRGEDAEASIARYLQIHDAQARSARAELERLRGLIEDASARLLSSFGAIGALSQTLREAVSEGQDVLTPDLRQALDNAVSALQFPDMATQLIAFMADPERVKVMSCSRKLPRRWAARRNYPPVNSRRCWRRSRAGSFPLRSSSRAWPAVRWNYFSDLAI